jgi:hypothetical protein
MMGIDDDTRDTLTRQVGELSGKQRSPADVHEDLRHAPAELAQARAAPRAEDHRPHAGTR